VVEVNSILVLVLAVFLSWHFGCCQYSVVFLYWHFGWWVRIAFLPERSKGFDSSSNVFVRVGSNPTECNLFALISPLSIVLVPVYRYVLMMTQNWFIFHVHVLCTSTSTLILSFFFFEWQRWEGSLLLCFILTLQVLTGFCKLLQESVIVTVNKTKSTTSIIEICFGLQELKNFQNICW
jgi:hypothetical protein